MLKFATKKPPRLKQSNVIVSEGHFLSDSGEGQGHSVPRYDEQSLSIEDSVDSGINQSVDFNGFKQNMDYDSYHDNKENVGHPGYHSRSVHSPIKETWKAFNVKYGKIGVEKEIEIPMESPAREVGMSRNINSYAGQRSHINPGYHDNTMISRGDVNRNLIQHPGTRQPVIYPRGSGYHFLHEGSQGQQSRSHPYGEDFNANRQYPAMQSNITGHHHNTNLSPSMESGSNYGPPYSFDSTASMSLDSVSTIGDPSSKSPSEYLDYDMVMDMHQSPQKQMDDKSSTSQHEHRHIHLGRGTHGLCEGSNSPLRPGSTESQSTMTSSLRKSPGYKSGHHVRWGPGVVNSSHKDMPVQHLSPNKKKKKTSLRTLLNLPKFPVSDDDLTVHGSNVEQGRFIQTRSPENQKKSPKQSPAKMVTKSPTPSSQLACLRYKTEYPASVLLSESSCQSPVRKPVPQLNITSANEFQSIFSLPITTQSHLYQGHHGELEQTHAIPHPIMHVGKQDSPGKGQVNSVRPFLINGQSNEIRDYDNCDETQPQKSSLISVRPSNMNESSVFAPSTVTGGSHHNVNNSQKEDVFNGLQTTGPSNIPVTFDTFVTWGNPSERNVIFDTFVTLGRPYATSTPVPNGSHSQGQVPYSGNNSGSFGLGNNLIIENTDKSAKNIGWNPLSSGQFNVNSGEFYKSSGQFLQSNPTDRKTYLNNNSTGALRPTSVPVVSHFTHKDTRVPVLTDQSTGRGMLGVQGQVGSPPPYEMDNRSYGKLSSPPSTFITWTPGPAVRPDVSAQTWQSHGNVMSHDTVGSHSNRSQHGNLPTFKDNCTYREKETEDYDDDVFLNLMSGLTSPSADQPGQARRKLDFVGVSGISEQVVTSCVPQLNHELNNDILNQNHSGYPKVQAVPGVSQQRGLNMSNLNEMVNRDNTDGGETDTILDLVYITERIISMSFASEEHETTYKYNLKEVTRMLKTKHHDNYLVINISDKRSDLAKYCPKVLEYGWPENCAPPLDRLCSICKAIDNWLEQDPSYVVVVHCKGGRGRIAVVIAAYMRYSNICASADQALDRFAMKRFYDDKLGGLPQPSQRRYVHYFAGLLSGAIQINSSALYLHHILIHGVPNFDLKGGCRPFIKVYQGMHPIFTSGVYNVTDNMQKVCISISPGIPLKGDILIKCYHKKNMAGQREIMWGCQFQTCAISHNSLVFSKNELDFAINDPRFPDVGKVEFVFGNNSEGLVQVSDFKSDVTVPVDDTTDALTRWDSYENFSKDGKMETDVNANGLQSSEGVDGFRVTQLDHSQGPVDGSLYAQVNKRKLESQIIQNGPSKLPNGGSFTSSLDSAPVSVTQNKNSSESWSYSMREQNQPAMTSYSTSSKSYSSSTSPRSKMAMDEKTQLDQILSDLLNDQAFVSQKSPQGTRSFKTVEDHLSPEGNVVVQRSDVTYKIPEVRQEKHYSVKTETKTVKQDSNFKPVNAFSYTPTSPDNSRSFEPIRSPGSPKAGSLPYRTDYENRYTKESSQQQQQSYQTNGSFSQADEHSMSWLQQQQAKLREKSQERDPNRVINEGKMIKELQKNKFFAQRALSDDESKTPSSMSNGPTSPYSYTVSRTHYDKSPEPTFRPHDTIPVVNSHTTYITEQTTSTSSKLSNKPPPSPSLARTVTPTQQSAPVPPPQRTSSRDYMQHQQQQPQHQPRNRTNSGGGAYQQSSSSSSWRTENYTQPRTVQRHYSESAYDREQFEKQQHASRSHTTPPASPRSVSPQTYQTYKTVYKTIHQREEDEPDFVQPVKVEKIEKNVEQRQQTVQEVNKPHYITEVIVQRTGGTDSKNSTLNRNVQLERTETDSRLEALEKSLQAASNSILATSPWQQQQQQQKQNISKSETRFETRSYETRSEKREERQHQQQSVQQSQVEAPAPPAPKNKIEVTEEDRITLKPIGPGVHQLEPEGSHTGTLGRDSTLGRATTPSFPTSPQSAESIIQAVHEKVRRMSLGSNQSLNSIGSHVTPPFPTTPRTPNQNVSVATGFPLPGPQPVRHQFNPRSYGSSSVSGQYSSQQSLNSVFEREPSETDRYNTIVSRQLLRSTTDPTYASIPDSNFSKGVGHHVISPTGTLSSSEKMQYSTQQYQQNNYNQFPQNNQQTYQHTSNQQYPQSNQQSYQQSGNQQYQTQTLPHNSQVSQPFQTSTLPHQSGFHQQQQPQQQQQQQFEQRQYQQSSSSSQQYSTQQYSSNTQDGTLHVETNPNRMLMTQHHGRSPSSPGSPPSPGNLQSLRHQLDIAHSMSNSAVSPGPHSTTGQSSPSVYFGLSRRGSLTSLADTDTIHSTPKFVKDTSKYWYKPNISREEAIVLLKDKAPGTFVVRDSNSFPGAFGLALKVATLPPNVQTKSTGDPMADLVRHFLIEPTSKGVRLRGCSNEPVFGSLASLVYQHSITPLALPCKLALPEADPVSMDMTSTVEMPSSAGALLAQGAACNVIYLNTIDTESLTGPQAVARACKLTFEHPPPKITLVHFKVSNQGITLTDNQRKLFFRRHYPVAAVTYCGMDPEDRKWKRDTDVPGVNVDVRVFGFVARKQGSISDNSCHLFAELDPDQPASAIVNFVTKIMIGQGKIKS